MKQLLSLVFISVLFSCSKTGDFYHNHESDSKTRYDEMQKKLNKYVEKGDMDSLRLLSVQLDTQMKLEDFLVKFREVDQIKWTLLLGTGILTAVVSIVTTLMTISIKQLPRKNSASVNLKDPLGQ